MNYIGYIAAILTTLSFIPQVIHTIKSQDTKSISLMMYTMFFFGTMAWLTYGILLFAWPIILANGVSMLLAGVILIMKVRNVLSGKDKTTH
jgi:MtN3 and saliva related transmembrane protein